MTWRECLPGPTAITPTHSSLVATRNSVSMANPKDSKLACSFRPWPRITCVEEMKRKHVSGRAAEQQEARIPMTHARVDARHSETKVVQQK